MSWFCDWVLADSVQYTALSNSNVHGHTICDVLKFLPELVAAAGSLIFANIVSVCSLISNLERSTDSRCKKIQLESDLLSALVVLGQLVKHLQLANLPEHAVLCEVPGQQCLCVAISVRVTALAYRNTFAQIGGTACDAVCSGKSALSWLQTLPQCGY